MLLFHLLSISSLIFLNLQGSQIKSKSVNVELLRSKNKNGTKFKTMKLKPNLLVNVVFKERFAKSHNLVLDFIYNKICLCDSLIMNYKQTIIEKLYFYFLMFNTI